MSFRNRAKCRNCGDIVESKYRHDWVCCSCFKNEASTRGFFLDGGPRELDSRCGGNYDDIEWLIEDSVTDQVQRTY